MPSLSLLCHFLMMCMTKGFPKFSLRFTVLIQIAGRGGGRRKALLYP